MNVSNVQYTAGLGGFLVLFGLGLMLWFLGRDLSRRLRRMRQREALRLDQQAKAEGHDRQQETSSGDANSEDDESDGGSTPARE
ncbi:MAG: hypothetical protein WA880_11840 [Ornithinimicrobium sp.]